MKLIQSLIMLLLLTGSSFAQFYIYETSSSKVIYFDKSHAYLVPHTARSLENALAFHKKFWNYTPDGKIAILFNDFTDGGNGGAMAMPFNYVNIGIAPFEYTYDVLPANERLGWLMNHELTHTVMTDKAANSDRFYRSLLSGKVIANDANPLTMLYSYLTTPRWYAPRWFHEGIATFMETWMSGGLGRALGGYDEMVFRSMVKENQYFYKVVGLETEGTAVDFKVGANSYLYGTRFTSFLANKYGMEKLRAFFGRDPGSSRFFASQFEDVYGVDVEDEWDNWIAWETEFQKKNLSIIKETEVTPVRRIVDKSIGSVSRGFIDRKRNKLILGNNYPGDMCHFAEIDIATGEKRKLTDMSSPTLYYVTSLAYDESTGTLFYSIHNNDWRSLESYNINTNEKKSLFQYSRTGDFAFNKKDKSLWGVRSSEGRTSVVRFAPPYETFSQVHTVPFGESFFDIDISPDGTLLSGTMADVSGNQKLVIFNIDSLLAGNGVAVKLYEFEQNSASNFTFSDDGKSLYGTSYYTGVSNVFKVRVSDGDAILLTNTETGLFRPLQYGADSLIAFEYTPLGMIPVVFKEKEITDIKPINYLGQEVFSNNPELESYTLPPPSAVSLDTLSISERDYNIISNLELSSLYPVVEGYKLFPAYGLAATFFDRTYVSSLKLSALYSPNKLLPQKERIHGEAEFNYFRWSLKGGYNKTDFYDLVGSTKQSRAGYYYSIAYKDYILFFKPTTLTYRLYLNGYGDLDELPDYQNVRASFDKMYSGGLNVHYSYSRKSLGGVEEEQGLNIDANIYSYYVNKEFFPKVNVNTDFGFLLPIRNSSFWVRTAVGKSFSKIKDPFNNFYFGAFGNNYIDHLAARRYREYTSFPGVEINELGGESFVKGTLEWNLPALRFRRFGFLPFYVTYARLSFFGMGLSLNPEKSNGLAMENYFNNGAQLDFELVLFSLIKSYLSFGYARSYSKGLLPGNEFMISLKIM